MDETTWPLFGLRLRTERLELRIPTDPELVDMVAAVRQGIVGDEPYPMSVGWVDEPEPRRTWNALAFHWRCRAAISPDDFNLVFGVFLDDVAIGTQDIGASDFTSLRGVSTGSWIARPWQGNGYAREMRAAVLELGFTCLDATHATSSARDTTTRSIKVSTGLGYRENGRLPFSFAGEVAEEVRFRLDRTDWEARVDRPSVEISGWEPCAPMFKPS
jgi:RimJ/RimL family protein N-acetyltransferase